ncbi:hypothetical protein [Streptomyces sp. AC555_RSS877]|uniref:hypothetical protein n=1 Tax=Streptomyces sp. AC555_RSS877 TaxID=2823688 RepID=UPI001C25E17C|nr:hypothetical protein [Streptomyces sp. AC555_RSS877]
MRRRLVAVAVSVLATTAAVGCGAGEDVDPVVEGTPPAAPYSGPLYLPTKDLDESTEQAALIESGAAGRALECDGEVYSGGQGERWSKGDGGSTPEEGLKLYFDIEQPEAPRSGYRAEREEDGRVLYSYDVAGRTKVAVVVAKDRKGAPGWGPEVNASCDPAELPARFTDSQGYEIWTDRSGKRLPTTTVSSGPGPEHCDWQSAHFLQLGRGEDGRQYVRDPGTVFDRDQLAAPYDGDVRLPEDARDTGYRLDERELWLTDDPSRAYVRTPDGVEAWPLAERGVACK